MKKFFMFLIIFVIIISSKNYVDNSNSIRFRVISHSNSIKDINMKEKVVDEVSQILFKKTNSKEEMNSEIYKNLKTIENRIDSLFKMNNYDRNFKILYGKNYFPNKKYRGINYSEGYYDSLIIEIGEGKGDNYFCILYPSLCIIDYKKNNKDRYSIKVLEYLESII